LIIEGAGGLMVPLNDQHFIIDLIQKTDAEVILVSRNYLGSINHTLLTYELLKQRNIKIKGLIFNGNENMATENSIVNYTKLPVLLNINEEQLFTKEIVAAYAKSFLKNYKSSFV
jgi:dethiobiotin synthetase